MWRCLRSVTRRYPPKPERISSMSLSRSSEMCSIALSLVLTPWRTPFLAALLVVIQTAGISTRAHMWDALYVDQVLAFTNVIYQRLITLDARRFYFPNCTINEIGSARDVIVSKYDRCYELLVGGAKFFHVYCKKRLEVSSAGDLFLRQPTARMILIVRRTTVVVKR